MKERYQFIALFDKEKAGYNLWFPDLEEAYTCAETLDDLFAAAKEVLALTLYGRGADKEAIPAPTPIEKLKIQAGETPLMVEVNLKIIKDRMNNRAVKKTLSIPAWLNAKAEAEDINFSQTLQQALLDKLV